MFNPLKNPFASAGNSRSARVNSSPPNSVLPQQSMLNDGSETATRGQLVQIMMRDLMRKNGIPPGWIQCQIQVISSRSKGPGIYVRLIVMQWDERLMKYAFAFQKALQTEIVQFEPQATTWLRGIAWQLEVAGSCPLTELPGKHFWQEQHHEEVDQFEIIPMPASAMPVTAPAQMSLAQPPVAEPVMLQVPELTVATSAPAVSSPDSLKPLPALFDVLPVQENDASQDLERLFAIRDNELAHQTANNPIPLGFEKTEPAPL